MLGSLGEGATLEHDEKLAILKTAVRDPTARPPVVAAISSLSTRKRRRAGESSEGAGCAGLMVLPPYVYKADWCEMKAHVAAILAPPA